MDKELLDQLIANANEHEPLDLTHVEHARFVRDLDVPCVVLLWHPRGDSDKVQHHFVKFQEVKIADTATVGIAAFWIVPPRGGWKLVTTPNGPMTEEFIQHQAADAGRLSRLWTQPKAWYHPSMA
jgi:hypothetical protein